MRVLTIVVTLLATSFASELISSDDIENLFRKYARNELSRAENENLKDIIEILYRPEHFSSESLENASGIRASLDCLVCRSAFAVAFGEVELGATDEEISEVIINLCVALNIESHNVCTGIVPLNIPIITHIIRTTPEATPRSFCGLVLQTAGNPNTCVIEDPRFEWQVELPQKTAVTNVPTVEAKPYKAVVITDAHLDPLYEAFGVGDCDEPTCCRKGQTAAQHFEYRTNIDESVLEETIVNDNGKVMLDLSKAPKIRDLKKSTRTRYLTNRNAAPAGFWGDYRSCDSPIWAVDNVIETIAETHKNVDVVYYIGDTIDHGVWETSYELISNMNRYFIEKIRKSFGDDVKVLPVIGNHESQPTNQFAPTSVTGPYINTTWLYDELADKWSFYLTEDAKASLRERGEFSMLIRPGLRVITLNNNVAYKYNWWIVYDPVDAKTHLDWLISELHKAELAGEKVHILAHIPPGVHDLTKTWTREYNRIVNRFSSTIAAEFNGHTHSDEFKIFYSPENTPINVAWGGGSATSYTYYNLNYKIVDFNGATYAPEAIANYVYNLTEANLTPNRPPHWFQLYDMKNTFGLTDLSAKSMDNLVHKMVTTNKIYLDMYAAFFSKVSDARWPHCNEACKLDNLCKTVVTVLWERQKCNELRGLYVTSS
ncbi:unnamed protein product [Chrysodeixis includens]|uniref:Sphingomyelin phosphodiesterase n=1 Tax=Chrysodeixis includens TaxID=689277 RepID=A0A9P0C2T8_CHRIL|nr:unnamed protein product [Chrysodeixis includens]